MSKTESTDRIIDRHELVRLVPYSINHILRLEAQGQFPERIKLGASRVGWSLAEVMDWIAERKDARFSRAE
jgi:predicted DNA-binding transcriptional regulator AlpA